MAQELTTDVVRMAYLLLLGREPEDEQVVTRALHYGSISALREAFLQSQEFRRIRQITPVVKPIESTPPIDSPPQEVEWKADEATTAELLAHVGVTWTLLGQDRPHWSVLSDDLFVPEKIGQTRDAFFKSGVQDCAMLLAVLRRLGFTSAMFPRLFEFGCGVARVTPFLARGFSHVVACDVSTSHLAIARDVLRRENIENVELCLANTQDFGMIGGFDLWFSRIVLQHNPPPVIAMVLRRALSLLNPGGIALFQVPTYARGYSFRIADYMKGLADARSVTGKIEMHVLPLPVIFDLAAQCGCEPLEVWQDDSVGNSAWLSNVITLRKRGGR
jgi:SAM-dependent methyltransferase